MDDNKILSMSVEIFYFLDSLNFMPMSLKRMPKSFDLTWGKGYYPHFFNTANNLYNVVPYLEPKYYEADYVEWWASPIFGMVRGEKGKIFHNKEELLTYCMDDVNVLRQACCAFRNLFKICKNGPFQAIYKNNINVQ